MCIAGGPRAEPDGRCLKRVTVFQIRASRFKALFLRMSLNRYTLLRGML